MNAFAAVAVAAVLATAAQAQGPAGPGQRPQLPDHWMTLDSLTQAVGLTPAQREKVAGPYNALNAVLKQGAAKRTAMRERWGGGGMRSMRDATDEQRQVMRARLDSMRAELQPLQDEADQYYLAIRAALTPEQQPKFDGLPKPSLMPQVRRQPG
jgi:hypothetical protein